MKACLFAAFSLLTIAFSAGSQQPLVGLIQGTVSNASGDPLPSVLLTATNIDSIEQENGRRSSATDKRGFYQFVDISPGRYSITLKRKGYRNDTVSLVTVYPGETVTMEDIKMLRVGG